MNTTLILAIIIALAVILTVIGEVWGTDKGHFWNYPFKITFEDQVKKNKGKQIIYRICWVILIIALWIDLIIMLHPILSGFGWLWMLLIIPASTLALIVGSLIIVIVIVVVIMVIKAIFSKIDF